MKMQLFFASMALLVLTFVGFGQTVDGDMSNDGGDNKANPIAAKVFQAAGPNVASIQSTVDQFRAAIGGVNNGVASNAAGLLTTGRREINWDGGNPNNTATSLGGTPFDQFLDGRGNRSITPGTGFVQAPPSGLADVFGNPSYANIFKAFSPSRLFSPIGSNITDTVFFIPGTAGATPAATKAFGVVLTDVDQPDGSGPGEKRGNRHASTLIEYFAADGQLLFSSYASASPGDGNLSFIGIVLDDARIARVRITTGAVPGADDTAKSDAVMMDDFIYGEPVALSSN
jgi:hypothetical protein